MIKNPPQGYKITTPSGEEKSQLTKITFQIDNNCYKRFLYQFGALPYLSMQLRGEKINYSNCDLIFAAQHLLNTERPWVVDLECVNALAGYCNIYLVRNLISKKLDSKECKAILPWSNWGSDTLLNSIDCTKFKDKIRVVRYTVPPKNKRNDIRKSGIRMLFVGSINQCGRMREMYKAVYENMEAFIQLQDKYDDLELVIRSNVTPEIRERASKHPKIKIIDTPLLDTQMEDLYRSADIFPHVGYEALNLSTLEAMSYGIPVIATNLYNIPEAVVHMKNGMLIDLPDPKLFYTENGCPNEYANPPIGIMKKFRTSMIDKTRDCMKMLIEDSSLRNNIRREAERTIESGEFSIEHKNSLLKEIFDKATS